MKTVEQKKVTYKLTLSNVTPISLILGGLPATDTDNSVRSSIVDLHHDRKPDTTYSAQKPDYYLCNIIDNKLYIYLWGNVSIGWDASFVLEIEVDDKKISVNPITGQANPHSRGYLYFENRISI